MTYFKYVLTFSLLLNVMFIITNITVIRNVFWFLYTYFRYYEPLFLGFVVGVFTYIYYELQQKIKKIFETKNKKDIKCTITFQDFPIHYFQ